jgi:hypothetical protein
MTSKLRKISQVLAVAGLAAVLTVGTVACSSGTQVSPPSDEPKNVVTEPAAEPEPTQEPVAEVGTRENPAPIGSEVKSDEWVVVINSVNFDVANDPVFIESNQFFDITLPEGEQFVGINVTYTYVGDDPEGGVPAFVQTDLVTAGGVTLPYDVIATYGNSIAFNPLYNGGTVTETVIRTTPTAEVEGLVIAVNPGVMADTVFVATK